MPAAKTASYILFAALVAAACALHLGPVVLAGLFGYMMLDLTHRLLVRVMPDLAARWVSVAIFFVAAAALGRLFGEFIHLAVYRMPMIATSLVPMVARMASDYGIDLPFDNIQELRGVLIEAIKENARSITAESGLLTRGFFHIVIAIFIAITKFLPDAQPERRPPSLFDALTTELQARVSLFMTSYEKVLGAQVLISLINTAITALFVAIVGIPYIHFLALATFILGIIPLVGNIAANAIIIGAALTQSPQLGLMALAFLVVSHKVQYILSGRIIGTTLKTPMWATLLGILAGEIVLGVPGIILAPAVLHYAREELAALPPPGGRTSAL